MTSTFSRADVLPVEMDVETPKNAQKPPKSSSFNPADALPVEEESGAKKAVRTAYQPLAGIAKRFTYPADLLQLIGQGEVLSELPNLQDISSGFYEDPYMQAFHEAAGIRPNFDPNQYLENTNQALQSYPTQGNIERYIEEKTGAPLQAEGTIQELLRLSGTAGAFRPGGLVQKGVSAAIAPATSAYLREKDYPKELADIAGLGFASVPLRSPGQAPNPAAQSAQRLISGPGGHAIQPSLSPFETADAILQDLQGREIAARPAPTPLNPGTAVLQRASQGPVPRGASLQSRVTERQGQQLGLQAAVLPRNPTLEQSVLEVFPNQIHNTTQAGSAVTHQIRNLDREDYQIVNDNYARSRELNANVSDINPQLAGELQNRIEDINSIPSPSTIQRKLIRESNRILRTLAQFDEEGNITGYTPITNQQLIDQIQSLRQLVDYDFAHGDASNIFRPLINDVQNAVLRSAQQSGATEAVEAFNLARNSYREWSELYNNDYVRPYRDTSNYDMSKNFKKLEDLDNFNVVSRLLDRTPEGQIMTNSIRREIADKHLSKFFENPRNINQRQLDKSLRELEAVLTPEQITQIRTSFTEQQRRFPHRVRTYRPPPTPLEVQTEKYTGKKPEFIENMMNSRSGIRQLREDLDKSDASRNLFNKHASEKVKDILYEGNTNLKLSGNRVSEILNKTKNRELIVELVGEEAFNAEMNAMQQIGEKEVRREDLIKFLKKSAYINKLGPVGLLF